jgi:predicted acetyltransferase
MLELRKLVSSDEHAFRAAVVEFKTHNPAWPFAFQFDDQTDFVSYVQKVGNWALGKDLGEFVPNSFLVAVVAGKIVGRVSLRHELNEFLLREGGHIGYGVVPSERRKGYAKEILRQSLQLARGLGIKRVLLTCDDNNEGSSRTIEAHGGKLENKILSPGMTIEKRRYWIEF